MNDQLIDRLCALNTDFYRKTASSFSSTRRNSWPGWERLADTAEKAFALEPASSANESGLASEAPRRALRIIDLACGNMRFETFLESRLSTTALSFTAVDNCSGFPQTPVKSDCEFVNADLIGLLRGNVPATLNDLPQADLAVSFGFAHHIPGKKLRSALISLIASVIAPGGIAAVSLWNFAQDPQMAQRAEETTARARELLRLPELEEGDYILGWQNEADAFRYCHSFSDGEIDELVRMASGSVQLIDRFEADGRTGNLNTYLIFQREA